MGMMILQNLSKRLLALGLIVSVAFSSIFPGAPVKAEAAGTGINANSKIEAENYSNVNLAASADLAITSNPSENTEGVTKIVGNTVNGSYAVYENIDFAADTSNFTARYAVNGSNAGGTIEVWIGASTSTVTLDDPATTGVDETNVSDGEKIGSLTVGQTDATKENVYQTGYNNLDIKPTTGVHTVYLFFKPDAGKTFTCNLNWFYFSKELKSIQVNPVKTTYAKGDFYNSNQDITVQAVYTDDSTGSEFIGRQDVTGFDSSAVTTSGQELTVTVRGLTAKYSIDIKNKVTGDITQPAPLTSVVNGTAKDSLGLPAKVSIATSLGAKVVDVIWDVTNIDYDPTIKAEQSFTVPGTVNLGTDIINPDNKTLTTTIDVTVKAATGFKFSFMSISDIHVTQVLDKTNQTQLDMEARIENNLKNALLDANRNKCSAITVVGDMVENADNPSVQLDKIKNEYTTFKNILTANTTIPSYYVLGNHDAKYENFQTVTDLLYNYTGMPVSKDKPYYDETINGYHFIFLSTDSENKDLAYISDNQISWLDSKLAEGASQDKPIFVFLHQPIGSTLPDSYLDSVSRSDPAQDEKLMKVLSKYPQTIMINGHIHNDITKLATVYNVKVCTMVRDGSAGKGYTNDGTKPQGLIFEVFDDRVEINGRDFNTKSNIWNYTVKNITSANVAADTNAPSAPQNLTVTHKTDTVVSFAWGDAKDNFSTDYNNVGVTGYYLYANGALINSTPIISDTYTLAGLAPNTNYTFTLVAKDLHGNTSPGSSVAVTTLATNDAPTNLALNKPANSSTSKDIDQNAVDGNGTTSWVSTNASGTEWLQVDLGAIYDISRWIVRNASSIVGGNPAYNAKTYTLKGSTDGVNWIVLDTVLSNVSAITDQFFNRTLARFVKLYYDTPSNYDEKTSSIATLYEFEVYGGNILKGTVAASPISNLPYGTAKTATDLRLPSKVTLATSSGKVSASVNWDVNGCNYNPSAASAQNFNVYGNIVLPAGVINPDGVSLFTAVNVSVEDRLTSLVLSPGSTKLTKGKTLQTSIQGYLGNGSLANLSKGTFAYASSNTKVATVSSTGLITANGGGSATISASVTLNGVNYPSSTITITVPSGDATLKSISYNGKSIAGFSSGTTTYYVMLPKTKKVPKVKAFVKNSKAKASIKATKKMPGTTTIKVTAEDGSTKTYNVKFSFDRISSVKLKAGSTKIKKGKTTQLSKQAYKGSTKADISNGNIQYSVSNKKILSVNSSGVIKAKAKGTATVKIKVVLNKVTYTSNTVTIKVG
jgi:Predicted phosphohydrolases